MYIDVSFPLCGKELGTVARLLDIWWDALYLTCVGYASSVISNGAALSPNVSPKPTVVHVSNTDKVDTNT